MNTSDYEHAAAAFTFGALSDLALREFAIGMSSWTATRKLVISELMGLYFKNLSRKRTAIYGGLGGLAIFILHLMLPKASIAETLVAAIAISAFQYLTVMYTPLEKKYPMLKTPLALIHFVLTVVVSVFTIIGINEVSSNLLRT